MRDIKAPALYKRGLLGDLPRELAIALTVLLSNLNYMKHIITLLLAPHDLTRVKLKFVATYHANKNLQTIQNQLFANGQRPSQQVQNLFSEIMGNTDSRWLREQNILRNLLVHYHIDTNSSVNLPITANRLEVIEELAQKSLEDIETLVDGYIERTINVLEAKFKLIDDPFRYGRVT
jgi:hypothetical protein